MLNLISKVLFHTHAIMYMALYGNNNDAYFSRHHIVAWVWPPC